jgi:hypothetical protein
MTLGHLVFAAHFFLIVFGRKTVESGPTRFGFQAADTATAGAPA